MCLDPVSCDILEKEYTLLNVHNQAVWVVRGISQVSTMDSSLNMYFELQHSDFMVYFRDG